MSFSNVCFCYSSLHPQLLQYSRITFRLYTGRYDLCFRPIVDDDDVVANQVYRRLLFFWN